jgi:hypothetical protein
MEYLFYIIESLFIAYVSWLSGVLLFNILKINFTDPIKLLILPLIIGYGLIANIGLFLALFGIFNKISFLLVFLFLFIASRNIIYNHFKSLKKIRIILSTKKIFKNYTLLKIIILIWFLFYFVILLFPWFWSPDGLAYHIPYVMDSVENGSIEFPIKNNNYFGHFPFLADFLFGITILIFNNFIVLKIIQFTAYISLFLIIINFAKKYIENEIFVYFLSILLLAHMTFVRAAIFGGMIDTFTHLYGLSSFLLIVEYLTNKNKQKIEKKYLITTGLLLGLSLATKYLGLFYALIIFIVLLAYYIIKKYKFKIIFLNLSLFLLSVFSMCGFWYLKNLITTGSPFSPFMTGNPANEFAIEDLKIEKKFYNYFIFPFAYWGIDKIFKTQFALYNALYFAGMYLSALYLIIKKGFTKLHFYLFLFIQLFLFLLFYWAHRPRFAISVFIVTILLFILQSDKIFSSLNKTRIKKYLITLNIFVSIASIILFAFTTDVYSKYFICLKSKDTQLACYARYSGASIYALDYINTNLSNENIASFFHAHYKYKLKNSNSIDYTLCINEAKNNSSRTSILNCIKQSDVNYFINRDDMQDIFKKYPKQDNYYYKSLVTEIFIENSEMIYEKYFDITNENIKLYKIKK